MSTYTNLPDSSLAQDKPLTQSIVRALRDNPDAYAQGDATAPTVKHPGSIKAWVNFNGTGTVAIRQSFNVSSITDLGTGLHKVNFTNAMAANYVPVANVNWNDSVSNVVNNVYQPTVNGFSIAAFGGAVYYDCIGVYAAAIGYLA